MPADDDASTTELYGSERRSVDHRGLSAVVLRSVFLVEWLQDPATDAVKSRPASGAALSCGHVPAGEGCNKLLRRLIIIVRTATVVAAVANHDDAELSFEH